MSLRAVLFAVPRKVLGHGNDPVFLEAADRLSTQQDDLLGDSPKERTPITGFSGLSFTSSTGARFMLMPMARSSRAARAAAWYAYSGFRSRQWPCSPETRSPLP